MHIDYAFKVDYNDINVSTNKFWWHNNYALYDSGIYYQGNKVGSVAWQVKCSKGIFNFIKLDVML
jgi:hypothetical protein